MSFELFRCDNLGHGIVMSGGDVSREVVVKWSS